MFFVHFLFPYFLSHVLLLIFGSKACELWIIVLRPHMLLLLCGVQKPPDSTLSSLMISIVLPSSSVRETDSFVNTWHTNKLYWYSYARYNRTRRHIVKTTSLRVPLETDDCWVPPRWRSGATTFDSLVEKNFWTSRSTTLRSEPLRYYSLALFVQYV